jgi:hypothetical protein
MSSPRKRSAGISSSYRFWRWLIRVWFALSFRRIRLLRAGDLSEDGPALLAVSQPASFLGGLILTAAIERSLHCLVPKSSVQGLLARVLARGLGMILCEDQGPSTESVPRAALHVLARRGTLVVFAGQNPSPQAAPGALASAAGFLIWKAEEGLSGRRLAVHPVHLFLPGSSPRAREWLIHVDSILDRPGGRPAARQDDGKGQAWASALEANFRENPFQLRPHDLQYFLADLEDLLRAALQEDWSSRPNWKQDAEGFALSRWAAEWVQQTNHSNPGRLVALREALDHYRGIKQRRALRQLEVEAAGSWMRSGSRRAIVWLETVIGLLIALYGLTNHLVIGLLLFLAGSFKKDNHRSRAAEWTIRGAVVLACYAAQVFLVGHGWGRAAAGYYAPTLPVTGAYLWRFGWLLRHRTRPLVKSLTLSALTSKANRLRRAFLGQLDQILTAYEETAGVSH